MVIIGFAYVQGVHPPHETNRKMKWKNNKIKKMNQNDHNVVYNWVKTSAFLRGNPTYNLGPHHPPTPTHPPSKNLEKSPLPPLRLNFLFPLYRFHHSVQTVTKKTIQSKNRIFENFFRINSILFFHIVETKDKASKQTLFDVHRWSRSRDTDHFITASKNRLVQFSPLVCTLKAVTMNAQWETIHGTGPTHSSTPSDNGLYLSF